MPISVNVDRGRCQGHGRCFADCPEVFDSDDAGFAVVTRPDPPPSLEPKLHRAASGCPEGAINVVVRRA